MASNDGDGIPLYSDQKSAGFVKFLMENMTISKADCDKAAEIIKQIELDYPQLNGKGDGQKMSDNLFGDVFVNALYVKAPLSWSGYEIQRLYEGMGERENWMDVGMEEVARTLRLPQEDMKVAAIWFRLQRLHKETMPPGKWAEADRRTDSPHRFWTLFYFAYLDFLRFDFGSYFKKTGWGDDLEDESVRCKIATDVVKQLIGYRGSDPLTSRIGDFGGYEEIAGRAKQEFWVGDMPEKPEVLLALAFQANGWASFRSGMNEDDGTCFAKTSQEVLLKVAKEGLSGEFKYAADEYERRALFFMLAQRLYIRKDLKTKFSRERALFAVLYLDFYRRPFGDVFVRKTFKKKWEAISFDKKEDFAMQCRRMLVEIRNEAANHWPKVECE